jgi:hypothetical protein
MVLFARRNRPRVIAEVTIEGLRNEEFFGIAHGRVVGHVPKGLAFGRHRTEKSSDTQSGEFPPAKLNAPARAFAPVVADSSRGHA